MGSLSQLVGCNFCPYHGNKCPWLPTLHYADVCVYIYEPTQLHGACRLITLQLPFRSKCHDGTGKAAATQTLECLHSVGPQCCTMWVYANHGQGFAAVLAYSGSQKSPFMYCLGALCWDTQAGSTPLKPWNRVMGTENIPGREAGVSEHYGASDKGKTTREEEEICHVNRRQKWLS
jgi:hypothetical protein